MTNFEVLRRKVDTQFDRIRTVKSHFVEKFQEADSLSALDWSQEVFEAVALERVLTTLKFWMDAIEALPDDAEELADTDRWGYLTKSVVGFALEKTTLQVFSTSVTSNLCGQCEAKAWARLARDINYLRDGDPVTPRAS